MTTSSNQKEYTPPLRGYCHSCIQGCMDSIPSQYKPTMDVKVQCMSWVHRGLIDNGRAFVDQGRTT